MKNRRSSLLGKLGVTQAEINSFCRKQKIDLLVIFGSFAKGAARSSSDLDVAVKFSKGKKWNHLQLIADLNQLFGFCFFIDAVVIRPEMGIILKNEVFSGGTPLFEKKDSLFVAEAFRAWLTFQEARPLIKRSHEEFMKRFWKDWAHVS